MRQLELPTVADRCSLTEAGNRQNDVDGKRGANEQCGRHTIAAARTGIVSMVSPARIRSLGCAAGSQLATAVWKASLIVAGGLRRGPASGKTAIRPTQRWQILTPSVTLM